MKFNVRSTIAVTFASTVLAGCSYMPKFLTDFSMPSFSSTSVSAKFVDGLLVGPSGMTLYTYDKDEASSGKSTCVGSCAVNWPPLTATVLDKDNSGGDFGVIVRDDGRWQWTFKGKPVHYFYKDNKPGDKTGDGFNQVWQAVKSSNSEDSRKS